MIKVADIVPDENQPRKMFSADKLARLRESIQKYGVMTPISVEEIDGKYLLVDGERRFRVSQELKLTELPAVILKPQNTIDRLIQQFHIQEQHEGWTASEKAVATLKLSHEMGIGVKELCQLLLIHPRVARQYLDINKLIDKDKFAKSEISPDFAVQIVSTRDTIRKTTTNILKKPFLRNDERAVEASLIARVRSGDIQRVPDMTKLKDAVHMDPKAISQIHNLKISTQEIFMNSNAYGSRYIRQIKNNAAYLSSKITAFLEHPDVEVDSQTVGNLERLQTKIRTLLTKVQ